MPDRYFLSESEVFHVAVECKALHRSNRYWPISAISEREVERRRLRACRLCSKPKTAVKAGYK